MNTDAVERVVLQPLRAKRALAMEMQDCARARPNPPSVPARTLLHGQVEYLAGKVQAFEEAIALVEHRLRVEGLVGSVTTRVGDPCVTYDYHGLPQIRTEYRLSPEERDAMIADGDARVATRGDARS